MGRKKVPVNVLLPEEMNEKIKNLATEVRRSRSAYIRQILRRYLQYVETRDDPSAEKSTGILIKSGGVYPREYPKKNRASIGLAGVSKGGRAPPFVSSWGRGSQGRDPIERVPPLCALLPTFPAREK